MSNNKLHAIGIMSGTSLDGIDVSYVSSDGKSIFTHNCSSLFKFRDSTRKSLHNLVNNFTKNKIKDEENLLKFLSLKGISLEDHKKNLVNSEKIKFIALQEFSKNAETEFINTKTLLDQYTYSLITVKESDLAHELYLQLDSEESEFSTF